MMHGMRLRLWAIVMAAGMMFGPGLTAQTADDGIRATIDGQISAFLEDDWTGAFAFASPSIRDIFRTPENFGRMVQQGYPMVWRPTELTYLELREVAGNLWQRVQVVDANGRVHWLDYQMVQIDGDWRINAVQLLPQPGVSV